MASVLSKKCSIAAASVVIVAGSTVLAAPVQAVSADLAFSCSTPLGDNEFGTIIDTNLPATLPAGKTAPVTTTVKAVVPASLAGLAYSVLQARTVEGTVVLKTTRDAKAAPDSSVAIPSTAVPASGPLTITAAGASAAFTGASGAHVLKAVSYTANLVFKKTDGSPAYSFSTTCTPKATTPAQNLTIDTVTVLPQVATTTKLTAKYAKASRSATVKVTVKAAGSTSTAGKVTLVLKKGTAKIKSVTASVSPSGTATAVFKKLTKKGAYTVTGTFAGSASTKASTGKASFKVK